MQTTLKQLAYHLGKLFPVKPRSVAEGTELCRTLQGHQLLTTLGRLSKAGDDPTQIVEEYQRASNSLSAGAAERFYLSVKPPALRFDHELTAAIASSALLNGHGVHLDSHKYHEAEPTFALLDQLLIRSLPCTETRRNWRFGLSLPTRWKRSSADACWAMEQGVRIRLVKGDFPAPPGEEVDAVQGCRDLVDQLAGKVPGLALATHDCALARECIERCRRAGSELQLELFFGRPASSLLALAKEYDVPVGFYIPYGDTLSVYLVRDLLTHPLKLLRGHPAELLGTLEAKLARIVRAL